MKLEEYHLKGIMANSVTGNDSIVSLDITENGQTKKFFPIIPRTVVQNSLSIPRKSLIVRTLQVSNGFGDAIVQIARVNSDGAIVFKNKFNLASYNYLLLWEGFIYLPQGMGLYCCTDVESTVDSTDYGVSVYASTILQDDVTNTAS